MHMEGFRRHIVHFFLSFTNHLVHCRFRCCIPELLSQLYKEVKQNDISLRCIFQISCIYSVKNYGVYSFAILLVPISSL